MNISSTNPQTPAPWQNGILTPGADYPRAIRAHVVELILFIFGGIMVSMISLVGGVRLLLNLGTIYNPFLRELAVWVGWALLGFAVVVIISAWSGVIWLRRMTHIEGFGAVPQAQVVAAPAVSAPQIAPETPGSLYEIGKRILWMHYQSNLDATRQQCQNAGIAPHDWNKISVVLREIKIRDDQKWEPMTYDQALMIWESKIMPAPNNGLWFKVNQNELRRIA
jgi:hypothetical protein